jgi:hypothetical protein
MTSTGSRLENSMPLSQVLDQQDQFRELAAILAAGVLRLRSRDALPAPSDEPTVPRNLADSGGNSLEVADRAVLSGCQRVNGPRSERRTT